MLIIGCSNLVFFSPISSTASLRNYEPNDTQETAKKTEFYYPVTNNYDYYDYDDRINTKGIVSYLDSQVDNDFFSVEMDSNGSAYGSNFDNRPPGGKIIVTYLSGSGFSVQLYYYNMVSNTVHNVSNAVILNNANKQVIYWHGITNTLPFLSNQMGYPLFVRINGLQDAMRPASYAVIHCISNYYVAP